MEDWSMLVIRRQKGESVVIDSRILVTVAGICASSR